MYNVVKLCKKELSGLKRLICLLAILVITLVGCGTHPTATQTPVPTVEKKWVEVGSWEATGKKNTENFKLENGFEYRINWETYSADGSLSLFINNEKGELLGMLIDVKGISEDTSPIRITAGTYNLSQITQATTKWKATIEKK